jgi:hypothetical protein
MSLRHSPRAAAARTLTTALQRETVLARSGTLADLAAAAEAKQAAFRQLNLSCASDGGAPCPPSAAEREAFAGLLAAARENAVVLEAVRVTLDDFAERLRKLMVSVADPGVYSPSGRSARHVLAARINACA